MYKPKDIVAVYGETPVGRTIHTEHQDLPQSAIDSGSVSEEHLQSILRFKLMEVVRVLGSTGPFRGLVVRPMEGEDTNPRLVNSRQVRLVQRNGVPAEKASATYIIVGVKPNGDDLYSVVNSVEEVNSAVSDYRGDYDNDDQEEYCSFQVFKGIEISSEFDL